MAFLENRNVTIKGIAAAVPSNTVEIRDIYHKEWGDVEDFIAATTVERIHKALPDQTASDLCHTAAEKLLSELEWSKDSVDLLIFISQTPDYYFVPATACHIQNRLGLPKTCMAFDITLGCSGWVYGLGIASSLLNNGTLKRALLLVGDTSSKTANPEDQGSAPLFGDAGTATALEFDSTNQFGIKSALFTDGDGYDAIICKEGGFRTPVTASSFPGFPDTHGRIRPPFCGEMDGMSVFTFAISQAPKSIKSLLEHFDIEKDCVDILALHQANLMINEKIIKKVKFNNARYPQSMRNYGNTSCASIPLTLVSAEHESLQNHKNLIVASGFGVGLSWGSVAFKTNCITVPELIEI